MARRRGLQHETSSERSASAPRRRRHRHHRKRSDDRSRSPPRDSRRSHRKKNSPDWVDSPVVEDGYSSAPASFAPHYPPDLRDPATQEWFYRQLAGYPYGDNGGRSAIYSRPSGPSNHHPQPPYPQSSFHRGAPPFFATFADPSRFRIPYRQEGEERAARYGEKPWDTEADRVRRIREPPTWAHAPLPDLDGQTFPLFIADTHHPAPAVVSMPLKEAEDFRERHKIRLQCPSDVLPPNPCVVFEVVGFRAEVTKKLQARFGAPTSIQAQGWPLVCSGHNLIAIGETGTGKTLTYVLPMLSHLEANAECCPIEQGKPRALVLTPTRELCAQIQEQSDDFMHPLGYRSVVLIGGQGGRYDIERTFASRKIHVVLATPGRLLDFVTREKLCLSDVTYFVLDEADRLLDRGFHSDIARIGKYIRPDRQTLLWTATWHNGVDMLSRQLFSQPPVRMTIGNEDAHTTATIKHEFIVVDSFEDKIPALIDFLKDKVQYRVIVFTTVRSDCPMIENAIKEHLPHHLCARIHGEQLQKDRDTVMRQFTSGVINIIISTNLIGRGIDFKRVYAVVNYSIPIEIEDYVNQCGRTGRAGADGLAVTLLVAGQEDYTRLNALEGVLTASDLPIPDELRAARQPRPLSERTPWIGAKVVPAVGWQGVEDKQTDDWHSVMIQPVSSSGDGVLPAEAASSPPVDEAWPPKATETLDFGTPDDSLTLSDGIGTLTDGIATLTDGIDTPAEGVNTLTDGKDTLAEGLDISADGLDFSPSPLGKDASDWEFGESIEGTLWDHDPSPQDDWTIDVAEGSNPGEQPQHIASSAD